MANTGFWQSEGMRATLELLVENGGSMAKADVMAAIKSRLKPSGEALEIVAGNERWFTYVSWATTDLRAAGWMIKDGSGLWRITPDGREALTRYPDALEMRSVAKRLYREANALIVEQSIRRAWLVRGSSVLGVNLVPQWLSEEWCSLAASQLPVVVEGIDRAALVALADGAYEHLKVQERRTKVEEIADFVCKMKPGDVVLTTSDESVYIGDIVGGASYTQSEGGRSNLRRIVRWQNGDAGIDFGYLPASLQAKLKTGDTIADITGELGAIEALGPGESDEPEPETAESRPRHVAFGPLGADVADELLVSPAWLDELVELLNEKRQLVFYGPPGTGKTFLARKIAARLVGEQQVRLVQFHPSYTYEDFFEGYRPQANSTSGTVSLELQAGPLRRLAKEAQEHPDQAFVLVIDELNRANIAKVFGELYFLLEYRDHAVEVLYGGEPFTLPTNLYFMCTMNTADRSIALLDAAMRRRFAFVELHPGSEPIASALASWLQRRGLPSTSATMLASLNSSIEDRDAHIGPSYFMNDDQLRERLSRIWRTQIVPLLQETYYDRWDAMQSRFDFDAIYAKALEVPGADT